MTRTLLGVLAAVSAFFASGAAALAEQPHDWETGFQPAASSIAQHVHWFYDWIMFPVMVAICTLVFVLLVYIVIRFRKKANPTPSRVTHNTLLEVVWTGVPILILIIIAIPSLRLLYYEQDIPKADLTLKATGHQWYWSYEYPDNGDIQFDAMLVQKSDLKPGQPRLLTADHVVVLPVGKVIRLETTSTDVIHSWALPAAAIKIDAVPGRLNQIWFNLLKPGMYYGQCSELCGINHGFMPITVKAVTPDQFKAWVAQQKQAMLDTGQKTVNVASAAQN